MGMLQSSVKSPSALHGYVPSGMTPEAWAKVQKDERAEASKGIGATGSNALRSTRRNALGQALGGLAGTLLPNAANAVSGGGKDFAEATIRSQKFDGQKLDNKDFSGADAVDATFKGEFERGTIFQERLRARRFHRSRPHGCFPRERQPEGCRFEWSARGGHRVLSNDS